MDEKEMDQAKNNFIQVMSRKIVNTLDSTWFYLTLWLILFWDEPDIIDAIIKILMNIN